MKLLTTKTGVARSLLCLTVIMVTICGVGCRRHPPEPRPTSYTFTMVPPTGYNFDHDLMTVTIETQQSVQIVSQLLAEVDSWFGGSGAQLPSPVAFSYLGTNGTTNRATWQLTFEDNWPAQNNCVNYFTRHGVTTKAGHPWAPGGWNYLIGQCNYPPLAKGEFHPVTDSIVFPAVPEAELIDAYPPYGQALQLYNPSSDLRVRVAEARFSISETNVPQESLYIGNPALEALTFQSIVPPQTIIERADSVTVDAPDQPLPDTGFVYLVMICDNPDNPAGTVETVYKLGPVVQPIPTLSEWGMIIFVVLLAGWMTFVVVRRWRAARATAA